MMIEMQLSNGLILELGLEILKRPLVERVDWDLRARYDHFAHLSHLWLLRIHIQ